MLVRPMRPDDWQAVEAIYRAGIATGQATFEAEPPSWEEFDRAKLTEHRFVAVEGGQVLGWAAVAPVSSRAVYVGVVEHSVYVAESGRGRGIGSALLSALISSTEEAGVWTIQSSVFPENEASLALHDRHGFRQLGRRERIAFMTYGSNAGQWRDTVLLERRSSIAGRCPARENCSSCQICG